jgi:hypothetical protein
VVSLSNPKRDAGHDNALRLMPRPIGGLATAGSPLDPARGDPELVEWVTISWFDRLTTLSSVEGPASAGVTLLIRRVADLASRNLRMFSTLGYNAIRFFFRGRSQPAVVVFERVHGGS